MFGENFETQCKMGCWGVGLVSGIVTLYLVGGEAGFIAGVMMAVALGVFLALVLQQLVCWQDEEEEETVAATGDHGAAAPAASPPKAAAPKDLTPAVPSPPAPTPPKPTPPVGKAPEPRLPNRADPLNARTGMGATAAKAAEADNASQADKIASGETEHSGGNAAASAVDPTFTSGATDAEAGAKPAATPAPAATTDYDDEGENQGTKPAGPRCAARRKGRQPEGNQGRRNRQLENLLHSMGFYHFDQIANWSKDEVAWVDANLQGFKGRVSRDNWIDQAKTLAAGGETEFSKRVDKGDVY